MEKRLRPALGSQSVAALSKVSTDAITSGNRLLSRPGRMFCCLARSSKMSCLCPTVIFQQKPPASVEIPPASVVSIRNRSTLLESVAISRENSKNAAVAACHAATRDEISGCYAAGTSRQRSGFARIQVSTPRSCEPHTVPQGGEMRKPRHVRQKHKRRKSTPATAVAIRNPPQSDLWHSPLQICTVVINTAPNDLPFSRTPRGDGGEAQLSGVARIVLATGPGSSALALFSSPLQTLGRDISARVQERNEARRRTRAPLEQRSVAPPRQLTGNPTVFAVWNDPEMERPRGSFNTVRRNHLFCFVRSIILCGGNTNLIGRSGILRANFVQSVQSVHALYAFTAYTKSMPWSAHPERAVSCRTSGAAELLVAARQVE
jgi:hypothetical protein